MYYTAKAEIQIGKVKNYGFTPVLSTTDRLPASCCRDVARNVSTGDVAFSCGVFRTTCHTQTPPATVAAAVIMAAVLWVARAIPALTGEAATAERISDSDSRCAGDIRSCDSSER